MTAAELCRKNGWLPGTVFQSQIGYGTFQITGIGMNDILAREAFAFEGNCRWHDFEGMFSILPPRLKYKKIDVAPSTPPRHERNGSNDRRRPHRRNKAAS